MREIVAKGDAPEVVAEAVIEGRQCGIAQTTLHRRKSCRQVRFCVASYPSPSSTRVFGNSTDLPV